MSRTFEVAVVGAGPAGSGTANYLASSGLQVLLLDKAEFPRDKTCGDALSPRAVYFLDQLGLGAALPGFGFRIEGISVSSPRQAKLVAPISPHPKYPHHGYVAMRSILDQEMLQRAIHAGARFEGGVHVRSISPNANSALSVAGVRKHRSIAYQARLVVLAVGASLPLLRQVGLSPHEVRYSFAARAYYEEVENLDHNLHFHFDGVPLPGYGWLFPLGEGRANVGAGFYRRSRRAPHTAGEMLTIFLNHPPVRQRLSNSRRVSPIKGFPLRTDFHRSKIVGRGILSVGEAAGLVNPFTGEGVDYALESAYLASRCIQRCFAEGDLSKRSLERYERAMRYRFQRNFRLMHLLRYIYLNHFLLDPLVSACGLWPDLSRRLIDILLEYRNPLWALTPGVMYRVLRCLRA